MVIFLTVTREVFKHDRQWAINADLTIVVTCKVEAIDLDDVRRADRSVVSAGEVVARAQASIRLLAVQQSIRNVVTGRAILVDRNRDAIRGLAQDTGSTNGARHRQHKGGTSIDVFEVNGSARLSTIATLKVTGIGRRILAICSIRVARSGEQLV